jgi:C4-dicarboxylate-specific signal transduction histidine kinase
VGCGCCTEGRTAKAARGRRRVPNAVRLSWATELDKRLATDDAGLRTAEAEARENERRYREAQLELAHANRVAAMGQLTASITHEVKQANYSGSHVRVSRSTFPKR